MSERVGAAAGGKPETAETVEPVTRPPKWLQEMVARRAIAATNLVYWYAETQGHIPEDNDRRPMAQELHGVSEALEARIQAGEFDSRVAVHEAAKAAITEKVKSMGLSTFEDLDARMKWSVDDLFKLYDANHLVTGANAHARVALKFDDGKMDKLDTWATGIFPVESRFNKLSDVVKGAYERTPRGSLFNTYMNLVLHDLGEFKTDDQEVAAAFEEMKKEIHEGFDRMIEYVPPTGPEDFSGFQTDDEVEAEDSAREEREKPEREKYHRNYSAYTTSVGTLNRAKLDLSNQGAPVELLNRIFGAARAADDVEKLVSKRKLDDPVEIRLTAVKALVKGMQEHFQPDELVDLGFELTQWDDEQLRRLCATRQEIHDIIDESGLDSEGQLELDDIAMRCDPVLGALRQQFSDSMKRMNLNEPDQAYRMLAGMGLSGALERSHPNATALREKIRAWAQS